MSLNDSSAVILIVGAIAVLAFVIHGLWFSGRSVNRRLAKNSKEDQEIVKSDGVGKVRIVTAKTPSQSTELKLETYGQVPRNGPEVPASGAEEAPAKPPLKGVALPVRRGDAIEINILSAPEKPYRGLDIQELSNKFGFIRGAHNIFCVYEDPNVANPVVVFRICSLEAPYNFPADMSEYQTFELALYMSVPERGKAGSYFKAMRMAADILVRQLGGTLRDNYESVLTEADLGLIEEELAKYDKEDGG